jgi:uncharacterized tellurite resistance protein B-like protein
MEETVMSLASLEMASLESVLALVVLAARADGRIHDAEVAEFKRQVVNGSEGRIDAVLADVMFDALHAGLASEDLEGRLRRIRAQLRDPALRESALGMAARIAMADGTFHVDEESFLRRAAEVLEISPESARRLIAQAQTR